MYTVMQLTYFVFVASYAICISFMVSYDRLDGGPFNSGDLSGKFFESSLNSETSGKNLRFSKYTILCRSWIYVPNTNYLIMRSGVKLMINPENILQWLQFANLQVTFINDVQCSTGIYVGRESEYYMYIKY